jgi:UDP-N-acetylmuramate: L-alanyl-gamma-D-glutamyl-meso-diaminopimelate ligase
MMSFPEFIYEHARNKQRVVIGGSHGKTTITAMIVHVLRYWNRSFDFVSGAKMEGFDLTVKLSDAPVIIIEGDEYPSSVLDKKPKFHHYHHHIGLISGIAWDHINMFPTLEAYVKQFETFADATPKAGTLIYSEDDNLASIIGNKERADVNNIPYKTHPYRTDREQTLLLNGDQEVPVEFFGKHNLQNVSGAKAVLKRLGINETQFYEAIRHFKGASKRMELIGQDGETKIYQDYAHAPSKVAATTEAFKTHYINKKLIACFELHTFSSLNKTFLNQYKGTFNTPDVAIIYYNPENFTAKKLEHFSSDEVKKAFDRDDLIVFNELQDLKEYLLNLDLKHKIILFMSSGNFNGLELKNFSKKLLQ